MDIGFESHSPNFYYRNSRVTAIYTADLDKLQELIPAEVRESCPADPGVAWPRPGRADGLHLPLLRQRQPRRSACPSSPTSPTRGTWAR